MRKISKEVEQLGMYCGTVVTPEKFARYCERAGEAEARPDGWALEVTTSHQMGLEIKCPTRPGRLGMTVFETARGLRLFAVALQVGVCQVRVLGDLADPLLRAMLKWSAKRGVLQFVCGVPGAAGARLLAPPLAVAQVGPVLELAFECWQLPGFEHYVEMAKAAVHLKAAALVGSSIEGLKVEDVSVCTILPIVPEDAGEVRAASVH